MSLGRGPALEHVDPEVARAVAAYRARAGRQVSLLAGDVHPSRAVREAAACALGETGAEGLPGARAYDACAEAECVEELARRRACALIGAEHANVQPHSAPLAALAAYAALACPGDVVVAPDPAEGVPHVHGGAMALAARLLRFVHHGVHRETGAVELDQVEALLRRHRPALLVAGGAVAPSGPDYAEYAALARAHGARLLVDATHVAGLVAAGLHPNPVPHADAVVVCTQRGLRGPRGGIVLCRAEHARSVDRAVWPGLQGAPGAHELAAKAVCLGEAAEPGFAGYQGQAVRNARALAAGLAARGLRLVGGGTATHILVADLRGLGLSGRQAERACGQAGVLLSRHPVPCDPLPPPRCSGLRAATAAATSRGMGEAEMAVLSDVVAGVLGMLADGCTDGDERARAAAERVTDLAARFPVPA